MNGPEWDGMQRNSKICSSFVFYENGTDLSGTELESSYCTRAWQSGTLRSTEGLHFRIFFINPRRACAARVTVLALCVCLSVCLSVHYSILASHAITRQTRDTSDFSVTWAAKIKRRFV